MFADISFTGIINGKKGYNLTVCFLCMHVLPLSAFLSSFAFIQKIRKLKDGEGG